MQDPIVIVGMARTPMGGLQGSLSSLTAAQLGAAAIAAAVIGKQFADEILVADTGSADRTVEIARQYTKHIYHYPWNDDFAAARNFICEKVSTEYWIWLDADDIVPAESITAILKLKETLSKIVNGDHVIGSFLLKLFMKLFGIDVD